MRLLAWQWPCWSEQLWGSSAYSLCFCPSSGMCPEKTPDDWSIWGGLAACCRKRGGPKAVNNRLCLPLSGQQLWLARALWCGCCWSSQALTPWHTWLGRSLNTVVTSCRFTVRAKGISALRECEGLKVNPKFGKSNSYQHGPCTHLGCVPQISGMLKWKCVCA